MNRKKSKPILKAGTRAAAKSQAVVPDYYQKFRCIGPDCEDSCCIGWQVDIDQMAWQRYQKCQNDRLEPLFKSVVSLHTNKDKDRQTFGNYARVNMLANGHCPFLQSDMLCMIQKELGAEALPITCNSFPRTYNSFGERREYGLRVSCPEAARVVLLQPEPISFVLTERDAVLFARNERTGSVLIDPKQQSTLDKFRALILGILQFRELTLGARIMTLGWLLDEVGKVFSRPGIGNTGEILPVLTSISTLFADPAFIEAQFERIPVELPRKLQATTAFLANFFGKGVPRLQECILAFTAGLACNHNSAAEKSVDTTLACYQHAYDTYYMPYFCDKGYIFENYLVNQAFFNMFPFARERGSYLDQYRAMVFNLAIMQVLLVGMAGHFKGLSDTRVIQFIQSFERSSSHNESYHSKLIEAANSDSPSFVEVMWMLKER